MDGDYWNDYMVFIADKAPKRWISFSKKKKQQNNYFSILDEQQMVVVVAVMMCEML